MSSQRDRCLIHLCVIPRHLAESTQDLSVEVERRVQAVRAMGFRTENKHYYNPSMLGALGVPPHHRFTIYSPLPCSVPWEDDLQGLHDLCSLILWLSPGDGHRETQLLRMDGREADGNLFPITLWVPARAVLPYCGHSYCQAVSLPSFRLSGLWWQCSLPLPLQAFVVFLNPAHTSENSPFLSSSYSKKIFIF